MQGWKHQEFAALRERGLTVVPCLCFQERQALCTTALVMGQKRLSDRTEMLKSSLDSTPFADYNHLGFNLRSNIFQGEGTHVPMPDLQSWFHLHFAWAQGNHTALGRDLTVGDPHFPLLFILSTVFAFPGCGA